MKKYIPIFFACDDAFVKFTIVSLKSMIENASKSFIYKIHILHTNISEKMMDEVYKLENENFIISFVDVSAYLYSISDKLPIRDYYSKTTYYRLFIAEMFKEYNKAIYIDSDTIVTGDISKMYFHDLKDNYVGACNEQVMLQEDVYGRYVEEVLGISRDKYFNAGHLLINCVEFRRNHILDKFISLLNEYNFVVTQDEDYLNLLCKDHVLWIDNSWNTEVFGNICSSEDEMNVIHYIMVSKPWHYDDCRLQEYFWKYAKMTSVYEEIHNILLSYTEEEKIRDFESAKRLYQTAINEINRPDNYLRRKSILTSKLYRERPEFEKIKL